MHRKVDVQALKKQIIEKLASEGLFNNITGEILEAVEESIGIDNVHFNDALHPETHNDILEAVEKIVEWNLEAWNRDGSEFV